MSNHRIAELLVALRRKTEEHGIIWNETEERGVFQASFPNYSVRLYEAAGSFEDDTVDLVLQISNANGDVVEEVRDPELREYFENPFTYMRDLYELARRSAMGVDTAIDEIMKFLS